MLKYIMKTMLNEKATVYIQDAKGINMLEGSFIVGYGKSNSHVLELWAGNEYHYVVVSHSGGARAVDGNYQ